VWAVAPIPHTETDMIRSFLLPALAVALLVTGLTGSIRWVCASSTPEAHAVPPAEDPGTTAYRRGPTGPMFSIHRFVRDRSTPLYR
jgi:hypothetical protein